jgi:hypothetical protein
MEATDKEMVEILNFVFTQHHSNYSPSYISAYIEALKILGEDCRNQWTAYDVIDAIKRAIKTNP